MGKSNTAIIRRQVSCNVCHSRPYKNCYDCHFEKDKQGFKFYKNKAFNIQFKIGLSPIRSKKKPEKFAMAYRKIWKAWKFVRCADVICNSGIFWIGFKSAKIWLNQNLGYHVKKPNINRWWFIERLSKNPKNGDFGNFRINDINKLQTSKKQIQGFSTVSENIWFLAKLQIPFITTFQGPSKFECVICMCSFRKCLQLLKDIWL